MRVGEHLRLDVPGPVEVALDEALAPAERGDGLADRAVVQLGDLLDRPGDLQAAAAAAEGRLDGDREAVLLREGDDLVGALDRVLRSGDQRRARAQRDVARGDLVAEVADGLRRRADPSEPRLADRFREVGVLGEKSVAGVDCVGAGLFGRADDLVDDEVGVAGGAASEGVGLVSHSDVQGVTVGLGVHRDRRVAGIAAGADHPYRDLASVGDEHLLHCEASETRRAGWSAQY